MNIFWGIVLGSICGLFASAGVAIFRKHLLKKKQVAIEKQKKLESLERRAKRKESQRLAKEREANK